MHSSGPLFDTRCVLLQEMLDLGVDQLSTDDCAGLSEWLLMRAAATYEHSVRRAAARQTAAVLPVRQSQRLLQPLSSPVKLLRSLFG